LIVMPVFPTLSRRTLFTLLATLVLQAPAWAQGSPASGAAALRNQYTALRPLLADNAFRGPLYLVSAEMPKVLKGDVHAVVEHSFADVSAALSKPEHWCDVMILHQNIKFCRKSAEGGVPQVELRIGKKYDQPIASASRVAFAFRNVSTTPEYLAVELQAPDGPFDTYDYSILLEATPLDDGRTFLHMGYSFGYGSVSRMAMQLYLATIGHDKVGFTSASKPGEPPDYIGGMRGLVERNTMRYYLAIDAYLDALAAPPAEQVEKRLRDWFDATEKYPRQLHEMSRDAYLAMKRREYQRQQSAQ
jgi:hypothetical protein